MIPTYGRALNLLRWADSIKKNGLWCFQCQCYCRFNCHCQHSNPHHHAYPHSQTEQLASQEFSICNPWDSTNRVKTSKTPKKNLQQKRGKNGIIVLQY